MNKENIDKELLFQIYAEIKEEFSYLEYDISPIGTYPRKEAIKNQIGIIEKMLKLMKETV